MSKENNKKTLNAAKSTDTAKYILIAVIIIIAGYFIYNSFFKKDDIINKNVVIDPKERIKNVKEPQFKKEGMLEFVSKNKKDTIKKIDIEVADNDDERMQGLMYRKSMDDSKGMLFIFQKEEPQGFWMKNTVIPLDIMYVNSKKEIVKIFRYTTPFSEKDLPSGAPATYVVEVNGGFSDKYGVKEGDMISFQKQ